MGEKYRMDGFGTRASPDILLNGGYEGSIWEVKAGFVFKMRFRPYNSAAVRIRRIWQSIAVSKSR